MLITAVEQQKKDPSRYCVFIDGNFAFGLQKEDILYFKIQEGKELPQEKYQYIVETLVYIKAQDAALQYIGYKMRAEKEVARKLKEKEFSDEIINRVLEFLLKYGYVDDDKYCAAYIRECERLRPKGKFLLRLELLDKVGKEEVVSRAVEESEIDELQGACTFLEKKIRRKLQCTEKERKRLADGLQRRGYGFDVIKEAIGIMLDDNDK